MVINSLRALLARLKDSTGGRLVVLLAVVLLGGGTAALVIDSDGPDGPSPARTITFDPGVLGRHGATLPANAPVAVPADSADPGRAPDTTVVATAAAVATLNARAGDVDLKTETPSAINNAAQDIAAAHDQLPVAAPDAASYQRGCSSRFSGNYSSRRGVAPDVITLHETVSFDKRGWGDVFANATFLALPSTKASAHFIIDREGHCLYTVRAFDKAWTQGDGNPWSLSFETVNPATLSPRAPNYIDGPGRKRLISIIVDLSKDWNIPLRRARIVDCRPVRSGLADHNQWGACGGGHVDIFPHRDAVDPIIVDARRLCQKRYRTAGKRVPVRCRA